VHGRVTIEARPIHVEDLSNADDFPGGRAYARRFGYRTTLGVPLVRNGKVIGSISTRREEVKPFTDKQIALLQTFADQAVIAIENARLFTELQASNRELTTALDTQTATSEIFRVIAGSPTDVQRVFDTIAEHAWRLCDAAVSGVLLFDGQLVHVAALGNVGFDSPIRPTVPDAAE
jgi:transcriptional regulator with GAF, ATPase, and Fis domain